MFRRAMARSLRWLVVVAFVSIAGPALAQTPAKPSAAAPQGAPIDPALRADIERLMDITGASTRSVQFANAFLDSFVNGFRQTQQSLSPRLIEVVREVLSSEFDRAFNGPEIKDKQIAIYAKYFTHEDVKGMLAFYQTDLGKKTIAAMPSITREGVAIGEEWARANMPRVLNVLETRLRSEGLLPATDKLR